MSCVTKILTAELGVINNFIKPIIINTKSREASWDESLLQLTLLPSQDYPDIPLFLARQAISPM